MVKEKYEDLLDYRLRQLEKSKKAEREASSFYIVTSNKDRKTSQYPSFKSIPIEIRNNEQDFEILKIRYELQKRKTQKSSMVAPRIVRRSGYSYYEKILYNNLIKRGYNENQDFKHLYSIEGEDYILDFAFVNEKLDIECAGEPWHEKCRKPEKEQIRDEFLTNQGWKVLRFKFSTQNIKKDLISALRRIDLEIKKIRETTLR